MSNVVGGTIIWNLDVDDKEFTRKLGNAKKEANNAAGDIEDAFRKSNKGIVSSFDDAFKASKVFAGGLVAIGTSLIAGGGFGIKIAAEIETAKQGFATLLGSVQKADDAIAMIKKDAASTPFEFTNLVRANQMLTSVTKNAPQSEALLLNVGKALSAAGKSGAELDNVIVNLQQIANTAKISELDIRQFGFAGINILELLADYYGTTKDKAGDMVKDSKNAFADLEGAFAKAGEGGGKFSKAFTDQAGTATQLLSNFADVTKQTAAEIVTQTGIFDMFKNSLSGVIDALGKFQPDIIKTIKDLMTFIAEYGPVVVGVIVGGLTPALIGLGKALWFNVIPAMIALLPYIVVGGLIGAAILGIIKIVQNWGSIMSFLGNVISQVSGVISSVFNNLKQVVIKVWTDIKAQTDIFVNYISSLPAQIGAALMGVYNSFVSWGAGVWNYLSTQIPLWIKSVGQWFAALPQNIAYWLGFALGSIVQWGINTWTYFQTNVPLWINGIANFFTQLPGIIWIALTNTYNGFVLWGTNTWTYLSTEIPRWINSIILWMGDLLKRMGDSLLNIYNSFITWGTNTWNYLKVEVPKWVTNIVLWIASLPKKIADALGGMSTTVKGKFTDTWNGIVSEVSSWPGKISDWGKNIGNAFVNGVKDALNGLKDAFINGFNNAKGSIKGNSPPKEGPLKDIDKWGFNIGTAWVDGLTQAMGNFKNNIADILPVISEPAYATANSSSGVTSGGFKQDVTINIDKVQNQQDVDALGREFGFRQSLLL
jgi:tape measure domain-containing protein